MKESGGFAAARKAKICCTGNLCSKYSMNFVACLSECVPRTKISFPLVAHECVFDTKDVSEMEICHKRLLCYYYATTIYQMHGKGNRITLPACVVQAAREKCPKIYIDNSDNGGNVRECFMVALIFTSYVL